MAWVFLWLTTHSGLFETVLDWRGFSNPQVRMCSNLEQWKILSKVAKLYIWIRNLLESRMDLGFSNLRILMDGATIWE